MILYFVRHGQTDFNKNKIPQGQEIDVSLNDTGVKQAMEVIKFIPKDIDFIMSSPLKRAVETAEIINKKLNKRIELNEDLKELRYGSLAGKTWPEIMEITDDKDIKEKDDNITFDYSKYSGDTCEDLKKRVAKFVEEVIKKYPGKNILVATHGGVIDTMHVLYPQTERAVTDNGTLHEFHF